MSDFSRRSLLKTSLIGAAGTAAAAMGGAAHAAPPPPLRRRRGKFEGWDVVVIGGGCAGLAAAIEAKNAGASVCILEKMATPFGNTIYAGGHINATNTSVQKAQNISEPLDEFYKDMMTVSQGRGDPVLTRKYVDEVGPQIEWLQKECGVKFKKVIKEPWPGLYRSHVVTGELKPGGAQLSADMLNRVKALGLPMFTETKAIELIRTPDLRCIGVRAVGKNGLVSYMARGGVIICTGGFHANQEMVTKYMGGDVAWMPIRGSHYLTGENMTLTAPFFPMYVNLNQFHGGPIHGPTGANPSLMVNYGIMVRKDGTRFLDEVNTYVSVAKQLPRLIKDNWAFILIDNQVTDIPTIKVRLDRYARNKAPVYKGNTVAEAAKAAGIPADVLEKTVAEYNAAIKAGKGPSLNPPNTLKEARLIEKGPFFIVPFQGGMTATFGGPKINVNAEIINTEGKPIPGLYAAGNSIGGLFYDDYIVGSQLGACLVFGREAGRQAAARAKNAPKRGPQA